MFRVENAADHSLVQVLRFSESHQKPNHTVRENPLTPPLSGDIYVMQGGEGFVCDK